MKEIRRGKKGAGHVERKEEQEERKSQGRGNNLI